MGGSLASMGMRKVLREAGVLHPRSQNRDLGHPAKYIIPASFSSYSYHCSYRID